MVQIASKSAGAVFQRVNTRRLRERRPIGVGGIATESAPEYGAGFPSWGRFQGEVGFVGVKTK